MKVEPSSIETILPPGGSTLAHFVSWQPSRDGGRCPCGRACPARAIRQAFQACRILLCRGCGRRHNPADFML